MLSNSANLFTLIQLLTLGSQVYPNSQGSWAWPGRGRRCAWALPLRLALRTCGLRFALAACALPLQFALLPNGLGFALTTIEWIRLLQLNKFVYFALPWQQLNELIYYNEMNSFILHWKNLWIHILNGFISKWIHLCEKNKDGIWTMYQLCNNILPHHHWLAKQICFKQYLYYLYNMILISENMMSQTITDEFIYVSVWGNEINTWTMYN